MARRCRLGCCRARLSGSILVRVFFFFSSRRRHTRCLSDWSSDVCSSDLAATVLLGEQDRVRRAVDQGRHLGPAVPVGARVGVGHAAEDLEVAGVGGVARSEERRVGKEWRWRRATETGAQEEKQKEYVGKT